MKLSIQNYVRLAAECERAPNVICHTQIAADRDPCYLPVICQHCHLTWLLIAFIESVVGIPLCNLDIMYHGGIFYFFSP